MFKELLSLFRSDDAIGQMADDFQEMLAASRELTLRAGRIFWEEADGTDEPMEISRRDVAINKLERSIRRRVITHLTLGSERRDVPYCLLLMSIVKDVERIGDYAKNLSEVHRDGGASVPDDPRGKELRELREVVETAFGRAMNVFGTSDSTAAVGLMNQLRDVNRRCDELIPSVASAEYDAPTTTTLILGARYYKRIGSHVLNILTGIVMPLHKLDYYDEDQLEGLVDEAELSDAGDEED
ncbi:MAG: PhoU domain-containing protein [Longimicrobiales bacterium]|nr:PhoU domain-containing protein [Longimicrobiales bacterium]